MNDLYNDYAEVPVELCAEELELIEGAATAVGMSLREWIRVQLLQVIRQDVQKDHKTG